MIRLKLYGPFRAEDRPVVLWKAATMKVLPEPIRGPSLALAWAADPWPMRAIERLARHRPR